MPLRWEELGKIKSGAQFDIESGRARMKRLKAHPWAGIERIKQDLDRVGKLLNATAEVSKKKSRKK